LAVSKKRKTQFNHEEILLIKSKKCRSCTSTYWKIRNLEQEFFKSQRMGNPDVLPTNMHHITHKKAVVYNFLSNTLTSPKNSKTKEEDI
jgi:hypothetical protein